MTTEQMINEIMDYFHFHKVKKVMDTLNWHWIQTNGIPTEGEIREFARNLLMNSIKERRSLACGGFEVHYSEEDGVIYLQLRFVVDYWETSTNDDEE